MIDPRAMADALLVAERDRMPITPFSRAYPFLDVDTAYKAQSVFVEHHLHSGQRLVGAKLGMTSRVRREALGIQEPLYGWLTSAMIGQSGEPVPVDKLIHPRAEPEIAFLVGPDLELPATAAGVLAATIAVFAAIEVSDSRYSDRFRLPDSIADNAGAAWVVLGSRAALPAELPDLRLLGCVFRSRGEVVGTAAGGAALGNPAGAVAWLVNALAGKGERLPERALVLSGGLTATVPLKPRGIVTAEFDGLGSVEITS